MVAGSRVAVGGRKQNSEGEGRGRTEGRQSISDHAYVFSWQNALGYWYHLLTRNTVEENVPSSHPATHGGEGRTKIPYIQFGICCL